MAKYALNPPFLSKVAILPFCIHSQHIPGWYDVQQIYQSLFRKLVYPRIDQLYYILFSSNDLILIVFGVYSG